MNLRLLIKVRCRIGLIRIIAIFSARIQVFLAVVLWTCRSFALYCKHSRLKWQLSLLFDKRGWCSLLNHPIKILLLKQARNNQWNLIKNNAMVLRFIFDSAERLDALLNFNNHRWFILLFLRDKTLKVLVERLHVAFHLGLMWLLLLLLCIYQLSEVILEGLNTVSNFRKLYLLNIF